MARYYADRTVEWRHAGIEARRHLCVHGARKFRRTQNDRADLKQVTEFGLIKAAANYRAGMRTPFQGYTWIMIVGELCTTCATTSA
jgi:DNA-directed RNA polymerase specialized sigma subunit